MCSVYLRCDKPRRHVPGSRGCTLPALRSEPAVCGAEETHSQSRHALGWDMVGRTLPVVPGRQHSATDRRLITWPNNSLSFIETEISMPCSQTRHWALWSFKNLLYIHGISSRCSHLRLSQNLSVQFRCSDYNFIFISELLQACWRVCSPESSSLLWPS